MNFTQISTVLFLVIIAAIVCIIINIRVKNKNTYIIAQSRSNNLKNLIDEGFQTQDIKHLFFKGKEEIVFYFDYTNRLFAYETTDCKQKSVIIRGPYCMKDISAVALMQNGVMTSQNNIKPGVPLQTLYGLEENTTPPDKKSTLNSIDIKIIFNSAASEVLDIKLLKRNIKQTDENYAYCWQISKDLFEVFESELLKNWVKKEKIDSKQKSKVEKNYQDKLWELKNYREEGILNELLNYTKKLNEDN